MALSQRSVPRAPRTAARARVLPAPAGTGGGAPVLVVLGDVLTLVLAVDLFASTPRLWASAPAALTVALLAVQGRYRLGITPSVTRDIAALVGSVAVATVLVAALAPPAMVPDLLRLGVFSVPLLVAGRGAAYFALRCLRRRGDIVEPTLIVGAGGVGVEIAQVLQDHPEYGLVPVGFLDSFDDPTLPLPVLGSARALDGILREYDVRRVIVAFGAAREPEIVPVIRACDRASVDIHVLPRLFELGVAPEHSDTDDIWGIPLVRLKRGALRPAGRVVKRAFDLAVASAALAVTAPLLATLAVLVRLSSPGPVLFRQQRIGQHGRVVEVLKFRTLLVNDDSDVTWSVPGDDERVTRIGHFLRRTSLDELPQLLNVVRGDMSLVGPRPERPFFVRRFEDEVPRYGDRHRVPVGMTGWAQVHGLRGDTSIVERARFDNAYIENWSLWRDVVVLARTARELLRPHVR